jgi:cyclic pyranopterin phosphate synthase
MRTKSTRALPIDIEKRASQTEIPAGKKLTHIDEAGRPRMVDITGKADTDRIAVAKGLVRMQPATFKLIKQGGIAKGDVLAVAQLAGIMAAKKTPDLIPLCHPILIGSVNIEFKPDEKQSTVEITAAVESTGKTGVEMEALTATAVAALTIYDMCKAVDRGMKIENIRLVHKSGGKSGTIELE